ncbi:MAG: class I SAM-dependent methyltransferase [Lachnospiraceae bacterium]|nr:class I SAM-dependent methyltransferase [Lachnospiraceae bacterium]
MELSKRLQAIADMVTTGSRTADVGCDHGFVSIYLYENKIAPKVYAMDLREGPLQRAREHIEAKGFSDYIETRLSDGVEALAAGEADTLICAGMGGRLMAEILSKGHEKAAMMKELILQPQSELRYFREFLRQNGFAIVKENMIKEDGKFYPIIKAVYGGGRFGREMSSADGESIGETVSAEGGSIGKAVSADGLSGEALQRIADSFGPCLLADRHPVLKEYLEMLWERDEKILESLESAGKQAARREELCGELSDIAYCLALYEA